MGPKAGRGERVPYNDRRMTVVEVSAALRHLNCVDLAATLENGMPSWSTHPPLRILSGARNYREHGYYAQTLVISEHTGSHVDAPAHYSSQWADATIDTFPPSCLIGPYKKFDLSWANLEPGELADVDLLHECAARTGIALEQGDIALIQFGWDRYYPESPSAASAWWGANEPGLSAEACKYLADVAVSVVGSDTAGCDVAVRDGKILAIHGHETYFLPRGILIVEGLRNLAAIPAAGLFIALPLKVRAGSGSPIRPIALF